MRWCRVTIGIALLATIVAACGPTPAVTMAATAASTATALPAPSETLPTPTSTVLSAPATHPPAQQTPAFTVAVIVDTRSEPVTREQTQSVINEASGFLQGLTSMSLLMIDFVEDGGGGSTNDLASRYISSKAGAPPNGLVVFSFGDAGQARLSGGYSYALPGPPGFRNAFVSPVTGSNHIYVAVAHYSHKYAACGYGESDAVQSTSSLGGECRNQPGTPCIQHNGYSMCVDSIPRLYASTPTYFISSTIVHELMHPFSPEGDKDHYSTLECNSRMGYPAQFQDLQEDQYHHGLCPYVYETFSGSYQP